MYYFYDNDDNGSSSPANPRLLRLGWIILLVTMISMCVLISLAVCYPETWLGIGVCSIPFIFLAVVIGSILIAYGQ